MTGDWILVVVILVVEGKSTKVGPAEVKMTVTRVATLVDTILVKDTDDIDDTDRVEYIIILAGYRERRYHGERRRTRRQTCGIRIRVYESKAGRKRGKLGHGVTSQPPHRTPGCQGSEATALHHLLLIPLLRAI